MELQFRNLMLLLEIKTNVKLSSVGPFVVDKILRYILQSGRVL